MRGLLFRIMLTCINIIFPPVAVAILCGASFDCMLNCAFFLLAVIPSHVHGFYITCVYFHRRRKVRNGQYPGGAKTMIHSEYVLNGGARNAEVDRLWREEHGGSRRRSSRRNSRRGRRGDGAEQRVLD
ncbi:hypothetical protein DOTSEDRAFT_125712 [Dothistroma septosporum NZE10]|uniref:Stress response RCI peptide n=1 Tax=Dothistroma septosporum (strain NZE10 / CBS 128990) TaxID=675120 RepID=N1PVB5_DOTSN|nr:hypothetical protein DOTSEDRAFT_125712 [Dothistroma septosporum NZE10]